MKRQLMLVVFVMGLGLVLVPTRLVQMQGVETSPVSQDAAETQAHKGGRQGSSFNETQRIIEGFRISPVRLNLRGKNLALVGLGSYIVNTGGCADCHSNPTYAPGGNPFLGQPKRFNSDSYLAGGTMFGPAITSRNLTPDARGLPAGLTWPEFLRTMRTGVDLKRLPPHVPTAENDLLQVMPWPVYGQMTTHDLRAVYEYLRAIPSRPGFPRT
ncbi:MAG TPA: cytochrome C [Blastocatellia bacterium]|nr:cytochrome C [Blastocatellia bacterium]